MHFFQAHIEYSQDKPKSGPENTPEKVKKTPEIQSMLSNHNEIKEGLANGKTAGKIPKYWEIKQHTTK